MSDTSNKTPAPLPIGHLFAPVQQGMQMSIEAAKQSGQLPAGTLTQLTRDNCYEHGFTFSNGRFS